MTSSSHHARMTLLVQAIGVLLCLSLHTCQAQQRQKLDLNDLGSLLGGLGGGDGMGQASQECPQHCSSSNLHPVPKKHVRPYSNGCSVPPFLRESLGDYSHFTPCCDLHDTCYMSCGATKSMCDKEFGKCMKRVCRSRFKVSKAKADKCVGLASTFEVGVSMFGCQGYSELQGEGCDCVSSGDAHGRVKEYAEAFYNTYNATHALPDTIKEKYLDGSHRKPEEHGELLFRLYRKYTDSIEIISRDGMSGRNGPTHFTSEL